MRVTLCVDALSPQPNGIGRYTWELSRGLAGHEKISSLHYLARGRLIADPASLVDEGRLPRRARWKRIFDRWRTDRILSSTLVHGPNYFLPPGAGGGVITVHDLSVFRFPDTHPAARVQAFERQFLQSLERAVHIITDTETVRTELIETFSVSPACVTAVPLGVDERFRPLGSSATSEVLGRRGLAAGSYALCVATLEPRKKISELLAAWRRLPQRLRDRFPLVLAGGSGWRNESLLEEVRQGVADGWLRYFGFVQDHDLPALYAGAALFTYPSTYEGFGLPPLEAMASGVPVIVANRSCLPEVCDDAPRYIDPDDLIAFTSAIEESLVDETWRSQAVERGLERVRSFSWDRCIKGTVAVYSAAMAHP